MQASALEGKLLVRYKDEKAPELVVLWIKREIGCVHVCPEFIVSVSACMSADENEPGSLFRYVLPPHSIAADILTLASKSRSAHTSSAPMLSHKDSLIHKAFGQ